eukprot:15366182-Ditylum_brightwellii.AAC.2
MGSIECGVGGLEHGSGVAGRGMFLSGTLGGVAGCTCGFAVNGNGVGGTMISGICCAAGTCIGGTLGGATGGTLRSGAGLGLGGR